MQALQKQEQYLGVEVIFFVSTKRECELISSTFIQDQFSHFPCTTSRLIFFHGSQNSPRHADGVNLQVPATLPLAIVLLSVYPGV